jgi:thioredoxin reductase (NADPH)
VHPHARRGLLLNWNESRLYREEIAAAFAQRQAEGFVTKPSGTPDERFHRSVTELLDEWWRVRGPRTTAVHIVGVERTARVHEMCDLLQRHNMPFEFQRADSEAGAAILQTAGVNADTAPVVVLQDGRTFVDPTNIEIADALGARTRPGSGIYDLIVVGGGPAGLSAAVYAESEGLRTALIEPTAMGGQAGTSSMIRNYLGFPRGISGAELASRAVEQARLFGTDVVYGNAATGLRADGDLRVVTLTDGTEVTSRTVIIATGVSYRRLGVEELEPFEGAGVYFGASAIEAQGMAGRHVAVVGGGNSAGQAALHLARYAASVTLLVRGAGLAESMSQYLIDQLHAQGVAVRTRAEVVGGGGDGVLERIRVRDRDTGEVRDEVCGGLFVLIGAAPRTEWLPPEILRDRWGYVLTGPEVIAQGGRESWPLERDPFPHETSVPGVFAVGDARRGSVKRVASAVGEGSVVVSSVHQRLAETGGPPVVAAVPAAPAAHASPAPPSPDGEATPA